MKYLVDMDVVVDYLMGQQVADDLFAELLSDGAAISILSFSEIYEGIFGSREPSAAERVFRAFLERVPVLGISRAVAKRNGSLRNELRRHRRPVNHRAFDLLIAATAIQHGLEIVTRNLKDYDDIPGLKVYTFSS